MEPFVYDELRKREARDWWFVGRRRIISTLLNQYLVSKKNLSILDIGCGAGGMIDFFKQYGQVIGVDNNRKIVDFNLEKGKNVVYGDINKLNFPDNSFNLVTLLEILEHLNDDMAGLRGVFRVLKPKNILLVTVPAFPFLWSSHDSVAQHKRRYLKKELEKKLAKSGFKIIRISYINTFLFPIILLVRLFKNIFKIREGQSDFFEYPPFVNRFLGQIFGLEARFLKRFNFPFGVSLLAVVEKP